MKEEYEVRLSDMRSQYISEKNEYQIRHNEVQAKYDKLSLKMSELTQYHDRVSLRHHFLHQTKVIMRF